MVKTFRKRPTPIELEKQVIHEIKEIEPLD